MPKTRWIGLLIQFLGILTDYFYHYHNRIPAQASVLRLSSLKEGVWNKFLLPLSTVVEWYELHCNQFDYTYSTLWGKENETHEIQ